MNKLLFPWVFSLGLIAVGCSKSQPPINAPAPPPAPAEPAPAPAAVPEPAPPPATAPAVASPTPRAPVHRSPMEQARAAAASGGGVAGGGGGDGYLGSLAKAQQSAVKTIDLSALKNNIQLFNAQEGRFPKDLNELVTQRYIPKLPATQVGMKLSYNATNGEVSMVKQ